MRSLGGDMVERDLTASAYAVKQRFAYKAANGAASALDPDIFSRALSPEEHARFFQRRIKSWAPLYLRDAQDCDELKAARPELLAENFHAPGTYLRIYETRDPLGIGPNTLWFYGGVAWGQSVADRNAEHDRVDREIEEAEARGDPDTARALKEQQGTLYHGDVIGVWAWGMSTFPPGTEEETGSSRSSSASDPSMTPCASASWGLTIARGTRTALST